MQRMDSDDELPCVAVLQAFLDEIHAEAVKNELARYRKSCDKADLEHKPAPARRRDGTRAALGVWDGLNFLRNRLHMPIPTKPSSGFPSKQCRFSPAENINSSTASSHPCVS